MQALSTSSVVAMSYGPEEAPIGALAVIGPMRMNYGKVMSVVDHRGHRFALLADRIILNLLGSDLARLVKLVMVRAMPSGDQTRRPPESRCRRTGRFRIRLRRMMATFR
jgi:hypothetical protein